MAYHVKNKNSSNSHRGKNMRQFIFPTAHAYLKKEHRRTHPVVPNANKGSGTRGHPSQCKDQIRPKESQGGGQKIKEWLSTKVMAMTNTMSQVSPR